MPPLRQGLKSAGTGAASGVREGLLGQPEGLHAVLTGDMVARSCYSPAACYGCLRRD